MALKTLLAGCVDRGGGNGASQSGISAGYASTDIAGLVLTVPMSDLQPSNLGSFAASTAQAITGVADPSGTHGGASGFWSKGKQLIDFSLSYGNSNGIYIVLRLGIGAYCPAWVGVYCGGTFAYEDPNTGQTGNVPPWWTANSIAAYTNLHSKLAALYDNPATGNNQWLSSVTYAGTMTVFQECLLRGIAVTALNPGTNQMGMVSLGYYLGGGSQTTVGSDKWATDQCMQAHQAWDQTYQDMAFNPYQFLYCGANVNSQVFSGATNWRGTWTNTNTYALGDSVDTVSGGNHVQYVALRATPAGTALTNTTFWGQVRTQTSDSTGWDATVMARWRSLLQNQALIGNNSFRLGYSFTTGTDPMDQLYQAIAGFNPGTKIQTAASAKVGGSSSSTTPLTDCLDQCLAAGINWVELPNDYNNNTGGGKNANGTYVPPGTAGNTGSGGDATHGAAYYTSAMMALPRPSTGTATPETVQVSVAIAMSAAWAVTVLNPSNTGGGGGVSPEQGLVAYPLGPKLSEIFKP